MSSLKRSRSKKLTKQDLLCELRNAQEKKAKTTEDNPQPLSVRFAEKYQLIRDSRSALTKKETKIQEELKQVQREIKDNVAFQFEVKDAMEHKLPDYMARDVQSKEPLLMPLTLPCKCEARYSMFSVFELMQKHTMLNKEELIAFAQKAILESESTQSPFEGLAHLQCMACEKWCDMHAVTQEVLQQLKEHESFTIPLHKKILDWFGGDSNVDDEIPATLPESEDQPLEITLQRTSYDYTTIIAQQKCRYCSNSSDPLAL